jgi:rod shape-determining protein MreD
VGLVALLAWVLFAVAVPDLAPTWASMDRHAPDLFVALAVYLALKSDGVGVVAWGIVLGLLKDCVSLDPLGTHAFTIGTVTFLFARRRGRTEVVRGPAVAVSVAGGVLVAHALYVLRMIPVLREGPSFASLLSGAPVALWTALAAWPLLSLCDRLHAFDDLAASDRGVPA